MHKRRKAQTVYHGCIVGSNRVQVILSVKNAQVAGDTTDQKSTQTLKNSMQ